MDISSVMLLDLDEDVRFFIEYLMFKHKVEKLTEFEEELIKKMLESIQNSIDESISTTLENFELYKIPHLVRNIVSENIHNDINKEMFSFTMDIDVLHNKIKYLLNAISSLLDELERPKSISLRSTNTFDQDTIINLRRIIKDIAVEPT